MDIKNNPVVNTAKTAVTLTVYFVVLMAAMEASSYLYTNYSPTVKTGAKKLYKKVSDKVKFVKKNSMFFDKKLTKS